VDSERSNIAGQFIRQAKIWTYGWILRYSI
jgi:hypothetical protein